MHHGALENCIKFKLAFSSFPDKEGTWLHHTDCIFCSPSSCIHIISNIAKQEKRNVQRLKSKKYWNRAFYGWLILIERWFRNIDPSEEWALQERMGWLYIYPTVPPDPKVRVFDHRTLNDQQHYSYQQDGQTSPAPRHPEQYLWDGSMEEHRQLHVKQLLKKGLISATVSLPFRIPHIMASDLYNSLAWLPRDGRSQR